MPLEVISYEEPRLPLEVEPEPVLELEELLDDILILSFGMDESSCTVVLDYGLE